MQLFVQLTLAFTSAPVLKTLTLLHTITRRTILQKVPDRTFRSAFGACKHRVSGSFHSPPGVLFTFPSQYCFTIGHWVVFRLGGWSPRLPTGFLVSRGTLVLTSSASFSSTRLSRSPVPRPRRIRLTLQIHGVSPYPGKITLSGLASSPFARHY